MIKGVEHVLNRFNYLLILFLVVLLVLVGSYSAYQSFFSPSFSLPNTNPPTVVRFSDVSANPDAEPVPFLPNNLTNITNPDYTNFTVPAILKRGSNGGLDDLFRIQGEVEYPSVCGPVDVVVLLDMSGSMTQDWIGPGVRSKIDVAKQALSRLLRTVEARRDGSRVNLITFRGQIGEPDQNRAYVEILRRFQIAGNDQGFVQITNSNINQLTDIVNTGLPAPEGNTALPGGLSETLNAFQNRADKVRSPVLILLSDGVPTNDRVAHPRLVSPPYFRHYRAERVGILSVYNNDGSFKEPGDANSGIEAEGQDSGWDYLNGNPVNDGYVLADTMRAVKSLKENPDTFGIIITPIALQPDPNAGSQFNRGVLEYIAYGNGPREQQSNTFEPDQIDDLNEKITETIQERVCRGSFVLDLPPATLFSPLTFWFDHVTYQFADLNLATEEFTRKDPPNGGEKFVTTAKLVRPNGNTGLGDYYRITVSGIEVRANVRPFKVIFNKPVSKNSVDQMVNYLRTQGNLFSAKLTDRNCDGRSGASSYICLTTTAKFIKGSSVLGREKALFDVIPIGGIEVSGNIAGDNSIKGKSVAQPLSLSSGAIAVGGTITDVNGRQLTDYLDDSVVINWASVQNQLNSLFNKGVQQGVAFAKNNFAASPVPTINLNTSGSDPEGTTVHSLSTPPEGKLWYLNNNLTFQGPVTINGSGTIVVNGDVTFNGPISCQSGTRFGLMAKGKIVINTNSVECGSYLSLQGNGGAHGVEFANAADGAIRGIFSTSGTVTLPDPNNLNGAYRVDYDKTFGDNPTVLFKEALAAIFGA